MALATLNDGAVSLADANWDDATGFSTASADLLIQNNTATITGGLNQGGNPIDRLQIRGGAPRFSGLVTLEFDAAASTTPALLWDSAGFMRFAIEDGTNHLDHLLWRGGQGIWEDGAIDLYVVVEAGQFTVADAAEFGSAAELTINGGNVIVESSSGGDVLPVLTVNGGNVICRRTATTINWNGGVVTYDASSNATTLNANSSTGAFKPVRAFAGTVNQYGLAPTVSGLVKPTTVSTYNARGGPILKAGGLLTITTTNAFGRDAVSATGDFLGPA